MNELFVFVKNLVDSQLNNMYYFDHVHNWVVYCLGMELLKSGYNDTWVNYIIMITMNYILTYKELWKPLTFMNLTSYEISTFGRLLNVTNRSILIGNTPVSNYTRVKLTDNSGKRKMLAIHRLVGLTFIINSENKETIDHIDRNINNNHVLNLRWATKTEQANNRTKSPNNTGRSVYQFDLTGKLIKIWDSIMEAATFLGITNEFIGKCCRGECIIAGNYQWRYHEDIIQNLPDEIWKTVLIDNLRVLSISSHGRIKDENGRILKGSRSQSGYIIIQITRNVRYSAHRLVAHAFLKFDLDSELVVNHKNGIKTDNRLDNLEIVTQSENIRHAFDLGLNKTKHVAQHDVNNNMLNVYKSINEAGRATGVSAGHIVEVCKGIRITANGFKWKYVD